MAHALLRSEPAQLRVVDEFAPEAAHVLEDRFDLASDEGLGDDAHGFGLDVVAAPDREDEPVSLMAVG
ncbi:Uncharacterised protein [Mycobacteroides abscessus subsp. abscessus]|nr:Uncharacterised protein [Mycobacteroides abscessus subsp. abscessus]